MTKTILGLAVIVQLAACALQPSPEHWDALGNAKLENARARSLLDAQQYDQALTSIDRAATFAEDGRTSRHQSYLRLEAFTSMGSVDAATSAFANITSADSHDSNLFESALSASKAGLPNKAIVAAQQLIFEIFIAPPTQAEREAQVKESLSDEFTSVFGGGDFTVHLPPVRKKDPGLHKNLAASIVLMIAILRQNPGSEAAIEFLLKVPRPVGSVKLRGLSTVEEQIASGAFSSDSLVFARAFVENQYRSIRASKASHETYCDNYARYRPCKQGLDYWWYPDGR